MDMHDNEFDELFRSKLDGLEMAPSKNVWKGITEELDNKKRRKIAILPFLSVAASVIVLIGAGLLFIPQKQNANKKPHAKNNLAQNTPPVNVKAATTVNTAITPAKIAATTSLPVNRVAILQRAVKPSITTQSQPALAASSQQAPARPQDEPVLAALPQKTDMIAQKPVDTTAVLLAAATIAQQPEKPVLTAAAPPVSGIAQANPAPKKHKIKSFGDVLNVMIAAVDKRKDKFIEFSNTDGDEATITAVNLGIIKIRKEEN